MEKKLKPLSSKKAPTALDSHAAIEEWIQGVMPGLHPIVKRLDELIYSTISGLQYAVKWRKAFYGLPEQGWIIELATYDVSMNIVFYGGEEFDPPPSLGSTGRSRYVKVRTLEEVQEPLITDWIKQAGSLPGWK